MTKKGTEPDYAYLAQIKEKLNGRNTNLYHHVMSKIFDILFHFLQLATVTLTWWGQDRNRWHYWPPAVAS